MVSTTFLWYLIKISQYKSFSAAADALHVSQPALSSGIKSLEEQFNTKLLHRTNKGVSLTEDGKKVVEKAKQAFALLDDIEAMFIEPEQQDFILDDVIIYCNPAFSAFLLSTLSKQYSQKKSHNALQIFNIPPKVELNKLIRDSNNTIILTLLPNNYLLPADLSYTILGKSAAYAMCSQDFPYFTPEQTSVSLKELIDVPLGISAVSYDFQTKTMNLLKQYGEPNISVIAPDTTSLISAIQNGSVANIANKFTVNAEKYNLRYIPIRNTPIFHLCILYNKNTSPEIIQQLTDMLTPFLL